MIFDTHAHYDDEAFDQDRDDLLGSITKDYLILNPGIDLKTSEFSVQLSTLYNNVYAAVGFHPHELDKWTDDTIDELIKLSDNNKVVAIGEIGLDYHYDLEYKEYQQEKFDEQMDLARKLKLPVIIHDREAHQDCLDIIRKYKDVVGVFHCYSGSPEMAKTILDMGWNLSFNGAITFKGARKSHETIAMMPRDRIMIETDCPYLAPVPFRGSRNSSLNLKYVISTIAEIWNVTEQEVEDITYNNGVKFFNIEN